MLKTPGCWHLQEWKHVCYRKGLHTDPFLFLRGRIVLCWTTTGEATSSEKPTDASVICCQIPGAKKPQQILSILKAAAQEMENKHCASKSAVQLTWQVYLFPKLILDRIHFMNGKIVVHH